MSRTPAVQLRRSRGLSSGPGCGTSRGRHIGVWRYGREDEGVAEGAVRSASIVSQLALQAEAGELRDPSARAVQRVAPDLHALGPEDVEGPFPHHGFEKTEDLDVLAFKLGTERGPKLPELRVPAGVRAWLVTEETGLHRANAVEAVVLPTSSWDRTDTRAYLQGLSDLDLREGTPIRRRPDEAVSHVLRYLASVRNPENEGWDDAATAGAEVAGETVRLWGAGTLPGYRSRGAYRALVMERCRHAHSLGATLGLAKANAASSSPILRAAGFRRVATERRYALKIAARAIPRG